MTHSSGKPLRFEAPIPDDIASLIDGAVSPAIYQWATKASLVVALIVAVNRQRCFQIFYSGGSGIVR